MIEQWRDIPGYIGSYQASNLGRIRSVDRVVEPFWKNPRRLVGKILRSSPSNQYGHLAVHLLKDGVKRRMRVHRLVALTWIGPCPTGKEVRHGPAGKTDNSVGNLCYGTRSQNCLDMRRDGTHGGKAVSRSDGATFINANEASEKTGCSRSNINRVCRGELKTAGGYGWEFIK